MTELVRAGEVELSVEQRGDGEAVVLVAGGFMDMEQWEAQMDALGGPYRVIRFDHRGVGESEKPTEGYGIEQLAADTAALITALDAGPCVLWGNSLGGLVALSVVGFRSWPAEARVNHGTAVTVSAIYWHFLGVLWVFLFLLLLVGR